MMKAKRLMRCLPACLLAASMLLPVSCVKEQVEAIQEEGDAIVATTPAATRTFVDENLNVLWNAGDEISVFKQSMANRRYTFTGKDGEASGTFKYAGGAEFADGLDYIYGLYPYDANAVIDDEGWMLVSVSPEQEYAENGFAKGANVMVAASEDNTLKFKNVCGYVEFKLYGADVNVKQIVLKSNDGEFLAGDVWVKADPEAAPELDFDGPGETTVTLTAAEPVALGETEEDATSFWFVLTPNMLEEGFTLTVLDEEGETLFEKVSEEPLEIQRNTVVHLKAAEIVTGTFIDLLAEPLTWPIPQDWGDGATLAPTGYEDIALAKWVWGEQGATYPDGYPTYDVNKSMNRFRCVWKGDYFLFDVPVMEIPAGKTLVLYLPWRTGKKAPKCWAVEACLDGKNWVPMTLNASISGTVDADYTEADGSSAVAPLLVPGADKQNNVEATLEVTEAVKKASVKIRVIAISNLEVNGTVYASKPESNSNCHVYLFPYKNDNVSFDGPTLTVR